MADSLNETAIDPSFDDEALRAEFHSQTARINWCELQTHYARGLVVEVDAALDLVEVAVQLTRDNKEQFESWIAGGQVVRVQDTRAKELLTQNAELWSVVAPPWVLVQLISRP